MIVKELTELEFKEFTDRYPYSSIFQTVECAKTTPTIINGNIRKIDRTNLTYIESNRIIKNF